MLLCINSDVKWNMKKYSVFIQIIIKLLKLELNFPADRNKGNTE